MKAGRDELHAPRVHDEHDEHDAHDEHGPVVGIIPARLGSTRFPEKILASATGKPLIQHVWENARRASSFSSLSSLVIATDHERIKAVCEGFGARVVMTDHHHPNGTSRLAQAAGVLGLADNTVVVNIQGDEPEIEPMVIDAAVAALRANPHASVATIAAPFTLAQLHDGTADNPAIVKVVMTRANTALYFSRSKIPFPRDAAAAATAGLYRHVGLYAYRAAFLKVYAGLPPMPLEQAESLEQLRVLEHGHTIALAVCACEATGIDTPEQYAAFVARRNP